MVHIATVSMATMGRIGMVKQICDIQRMLCWYRMSRLPYYEPCRAIPMPDDLYNAISKNPKYIRCDPDHFPVADREEGNIIRAMDDSVVMDGVALAVRQALAALTPRQRKPVDLLMACPDSDLQFDFSAVALRLTESEYGRCAPPYPPAFRSAKAVRRKRICESWQEALAILGPVLEPFRNDFKKVLDR